MNSSHGSFEDLTTEVLELQIDDMLKSDGFEHLNKTPIKITIKSEESKHNTSKHSSILSSEYHSAKEEQYAPNVNENYINTFQEEQNTFHLPNINENYLLPNDSQKYEALSYAKKERAKSQANNRNNQSSLFL